MRVNLDLLMYGMEGKVSY